MFEGLFQPSHLVLVLLVAVLVFGPSRLPQMGAGLGKSIRDFKKAMADVTDEVGSATSPKALHAPPHASAVALGDATETKKA
jgi:sec-independent protein translocase protein TatA